MSYEQFASMENPKATGKEWHGRGHPQYNPEIHLPMLLDVYANGGGLAAFLAACQISSATFYQWLKDKPEFKHQYELARNVGCATWELMPLEAAKSGASFNYNWWFLLWRKRYGQSPAHLKNAENDSTMSKMKAVWESLEDGGVTPQEFNQIASGLSTESRIVEVEIQREVVEQMKKSPISKELSDAAIKAAMLVLSGKGHVVENEEVKIENS